MLPHSWSSLTRAYSYKVILFNILYDYLRLGMKLLANSICGFKQLHTNPKGIVALGPR